MSVAKKFHAENFVTVSKNFSTSALINFAEKIDKIQEIAPRFGELKEKLLNLQQKVQKTFSENYLQNDDDEIPIWELATDIENELLEWQQMIRVADELKIILSNLTYLNPDCNEILF